MSQFQLVLDRQYPNAPTVYTPGGKKFRLSEYQDARFRLRLGKAGPMLVQECFVTGPGEDVIVSLVPEGWLRNQRGAQDPNVAEVVMGAEYLANFADHAVTALDDLAEKVKVVAGETPGEKAEALKFVGEYLPNLYASAQQAGYRTNMKVQLNNVGYLIGRAGLLTKMKGHLTSLIETWNGKNYVQKSIEELMKQVDDSAAKIDDKAFATGFTPWVNIKSSLSTIKREVLATHTAVCQNEGNWR